MDFIILHRQPDDKPALHLIVFRQMNESIADINVKTKIPKTFVLGIFGEELLTRFELVTSALPRRRSTD